MNLKLSTEKENTMLWLIPFQGKKKKQKVHDVLFLFRNLIGWEKQGYNGSKIIQQLQEYPNSLDKFLWKNDFI